MKANKSDFTYFYLRLLAFICREIARWLNPRLRNDRPVACRGIAAGA
jgi:hypothetical protein